jgi:hypothetical protein
MRRMMAGLGSFGVLACGGAETESGLDAKQRWLDRAPQQYVAKSCSQGFVAPTCTVSSVEAGEAVETQVQDLSGAWQAEEPARDVVDEILSESTGDTGDGCERRVEPHPTYAFPAEVYFDCSEEGWGLAITCFEADTLDLARCQ